MNKQWFRVGSHAAVAPTHGVRLERKDGQALTRAEDDIAEAQRRIERQIILIGELTERGESVLEPEQALVRLETKMVESRDRHRQLLEKLSAVTKPNPPDTALLDRMTDPDQLQS